MGQGSLKASLGTKWVKRCGFKPASLNASFSIWSPQWPPQELTAPGPAFLTLSHLTSPFELDATVPSLWGNRGLEEFTALNSDLLSSGNGRRTQVRVRPKPISFQYPAPLCLKEQCYHLPLLSLVQRGVTGSQQPGRGWARCSSVTPEVGEERTTDPQSLWAGAEAEPDTTRKGEQCKANVGPGIGAARSLKAQSRNLPFAMSQTFLGRRLLHTPSFPGSIHNCRVNQFSSVTQSRLTLCDPMDCSTPGLPVHHQLPELSQTHVH